MKNTLKKIIIFTIFLLTILNCYTVCSANVQITNENLTSAFQKFESSEENQDKYSITLENNQIKVTTSNGEVYVMNYNTDVDGKITFILEMPIKDGMSYNDFKRQTKNLDLPVIGYLAVANIQGIEYKDSKAYFYSYLDNEFNGFLTNNNSYVVIDDINQSNSVMIDNNATIINASEFSSKVMEYVENIYKDKQTINDSDDINSFVWSIEKQDIANSNTSCKLVSTLTINLNADFSKLKNYYNLANNSSVQNIPSNTVGSVTSENNNENVDNTTTNSNLPAVGKEIVIDIICVVSLIILVVAMVIAKKYKGI